LLTSELRHITSQNFISQSYFGELNTPSSEDKILTKKHAGMNKIFWLNTDERISQQEFEKTNSGPLSAKVANNRIDQVQVQETVGHGHLERQTNRVPQLQFCDVECDTVMTSSSH